VTRRILMFLVTMNVLALCSTASLADTPIKPKLIVAISVDQFSADLFGEYRERFSDGFKRLDSGAVFPRGYQSHAATETCPGHSTILTGSRPARTGIIANDWQVPTLQRKQGNGITYDVYCAESPGAPGSDAATKEISSQYLRVPTLGDRLKAIDARSKVAAISGKDRAAVMMGGPSADVTLWWNGKAFVTYTQRTASIPAEIAAVNSRAQAAIAKPSPIKLPAQCEARSLPVAITPNRTVGVLQPRKASDAGGWQASPAFDAATLDAALTTLHALRLGHGAATDVLAISFSATDYVGHTYGTEGAEMCNQLLALDHLLGKLLTALDQNNAAYVVVLTADHGGHDLPERNKLQGLPAAQRVDPSLAAREVGAVLAGQLDLSDNPLLGRSVYGDMYLSTTVPADKRSAVLDAAVKFYRAQPQVAAVFTKAELIAAPPLSTPVDEWSLLERARASFDAERSGDFVVLLKPYVTPVIGVGATHGSPWGYDRRVPILFWWQGMRGFEQSNAVETVDILPTLASLIDLTIPNEEIDGRCLDLMAGVPSNCW